MTGHFPAVSHLIFPSPNRLLLSCSSPWQRHNHLILIRNSNPPNAFGKTKRMRSETNVGNGGGHFLWLGWFVSTFDSSFWAPIASRDFSPFLEHLPAPSSGAGVGFLVVISMTDVVLLRLKPKWKSFAFSAQRTKEGGGRASILDDFRTWFWTEINLKYSEKNSTGSQQLWLWFHKFLQGYNIF